MSAATDSRSDRTRSRDDGNEDVPQTAEFTPSGSLPVNQAVGAAMNSSQSDSQSLIAPTSQTAAAGVNPLPEQTRKRPRLSCSLHSLADIGLQLALQFLDTRSRLKAARCNQRLLQAVSAPFAWRSAPPFVITAQSAADVERIQTSLLRFAPVTLRCDEMESLQCVTAVPHLVGLDLQIAPGGRAAADLSRLLQHPSLARLQTMRLDAEASLLMTVRTMRLVARLPQLRSFGMVVPEGAAGATLVQPLTAAPALTDLAVTFLEWTVPDAALLAAIGGCAGLSRLSLRSPSFPGGAFLALCSLPNMSRLRHLELADCFAEAEWAGNFGPADADEYGTAFSALEQLQSLTLENVVGINALLPRVHRAPALRLLSLRCAPDWSGARSSLPIREEVRALLTAAPQLEVRLLLMPSTLDRWLSVDPSASAASRAPLEQQWHELQLMAAESERVTIICEDLYSAS